MFDLSDLGKLFILFGGVIVVLGVVLALFGRVPFVGQSPGDIGVRAQGFSCFFPIASSIVLSVVLTLLLNLVLRLFNR